MAVTACGVRPLLSACSSMLLVIVALSPPPPSASYHHHQHRGIPAPRTDPGTTYSCIGTWQNGCVEIIANDQGDIAVPSYVSFSDTDHLTGGWHSVLPPPHVFFICLK